MWSCQILRFDTPARKEICMVFRVWYLGNHHIINPNGSLDWYLSQLKTLTSARLNEISTYCHCWGWNLKPLVLQCTALTAETLGASLHCFDWNLKPLVLHCTALTAGTWNPWCFSALLWQLEPETLGASVHCFDSSAMFHPNLKPLVLQCTALTAQRCSTPTWNPWCFSALLWQLSDVPPQP
jgi:hypothetical protein